MLHLPCVPSIRYSHGHTSLMLLHTMDNKVDKYLPLKYANPAFHTVSMDINLAALWVRCSKHDHTSERAEA